MSGQHPEPGERFISGLRYASEFFMGQSNLQKAVTKLAKRLDELGVPYAIAGALALNEHGYERTTKDVDIILTREGLKTFKERWLRRGYVERFEGSKGLRDTENKVDIDVILTGEYPGDGKPKPVRFPDPEVAQVYGQFRVLPLEKLIELKLASGMSARHRRRDLADVLEVIRIKNLPLDFENQLDPSVRSQYRELWEDAHSDQP